MILCGFVFGFFALLIIYVRWVAKKTDPEPKYGVYMQRGKFYWHKYFFLLAVFKFQKWREERKSTNETFEYEKIDRLQELSEHPKTFDAIAFVGCNNEGFRFLIELERRKRGITHAVLHLWIPGKGLFRLPTLPDTKIFTMQNGWESTNYKSAGIDAYPIIPMKKWKLTFKGDLKIGDDIIPAQIDAEFTTTFKPFDFDKDLSPKALADGIAKEKWIKSYFYRLNLHRQSHYEQMGFIQADFLIGDQEFKEIKLQAFRDHSYGLQRDWSVMHRYAYYLLFLDNGTYVVLCAICQPDVLSNIKLGYICKPTGEYLPIVTSNFKLYEHGENGVPPDNLTFQFETKKEIFTVHVTVENSTERYHGPNWEARIILQFLKCKVNGISGYGICDYQYNNKSGRPSNLVEKDPVWYKKIMEIEERIRKTNEVFAKKMK